MTMNMENSKLSLSTAAVAVLGLCVSSVAAQGTVVGTAEPGTMDDTFTVPFSEFDATAASGCGMTYAGCTGEFFELSHDINGTITVIDDCTFRIQGWQFDGLGPAVEWWGSMQEGSVTEFPYPANAIKIGELGAPGSYQQGSADGGDSDVVVRLGLDDIGAQIELSDEINHISVWCEDVAIDFGNAALMCDGVAAASPKAAKPAEAEAEGTPEAAKPAEAEAEGTSNAPGAPAEAEGMPEVEAEATPAGPATTTDATDADTAVPETTEPSSALPMQSAMGVVAAVAAVAFL